MPQPEVVEGLGFIPIEVLEWEESLGELTQEQIDREHRRLRVVYHFVTGTRKPGGLRDEALRKIAAGQGVNYIFRHWTVAKTVQAAYPGRESEDRVIYPILAENWKEKHGYYPNSYEANLIRDQIFAQTLKGPALAAILLDPRGNPYAHINPVNIIDSVSDIVDADRMAREIQYIRSLSVSRASIIPQLPLASPEGLTVEQRRLLTQNVLALTTREGPFEIPPPAEEGGIFQGLPAIAEARKAAAEEEEAKTLEGKLRAEWRKYRLLDPTDEQIAILSAFELALVTDDRDEAEALLPMLNGQVAGFALTTGRMDEMQILGMSGSIEREMRTLMEIEIAKKKDDLTDDQVDRLWASVGKWAEQLFGEMVQSPIVFRAGLTNVVGQYTRKKIVAVDQLEDSAMTREAITDRLRNRWAKLLAPGGAWGKSTRLSALGPDDFGLLASAVQGELTQLQIADVELPTGEWFSSPEALALTEADLDAAIAKALKDFATPILADEQQTDMDFKESFDEIRLDQYLGTDNFDLLKKAAAITGDSVLDLLKEVTEAAGREGINLSDNLSAQVKAALDRVLLDIPEEAATEIRAEMARRKRRDDENHVNSLFVDEDKDPLPGTKELIEAAEILGKTSRELIAPFIGAFNRGDITLLDVVESTLDHEAENLPRELVQAAKNSIADLKIERAKKEVQKEQLDEFNDAQILEALQEADNFDLLELAAQEMNITPLELYKMVSQQFVDEAPLDFVVDEALKFGLTQVTPEAAEPIQAQWDIRKAKTEEIKTQDFVVLNDLLNVPGFRQLQFVAGTLKTTPQELLSPLQERIDSGALSWQDAILQVIEEQQSALAESSAGERGGQMLLEEAKEAQDIFKAKQDELFLEGFSAARSIQLLQAATDFLGLDMADLLREQERFAGEAGVSLTTEELTRKALEGLEKKLTPEQRKRFVVDIPEGALEEEQKIELGQAAQVAAVSPPTPVSIEQMGQAKQFESVLASLREHQGQDPSTLILGGTVKIGEALPFQLSQEARRVTESFIEQQLEEGGGQQAAFGQRTAALREQQRPRTTRFPAPGRVRRFSP